MAFTYDPTLGTDRDKVRFQIGDTNSARPATQRLEDEEIDATKALEGSLKKTAIACAEALLSRWLALPTEKQTGDLRLIWKDRIAGLRARIAQLKEDQVALVKPYAGGISKSDREALEADEDRTDQPFKTGMLDNPRAS